MGFSIFRRILSSSTNLLWVFNDVIIDDSLSEFRIAARSLFLFAQKHVLALVSDHYIWFLFAPCSVIVLVDFVDDIWSVRRAVLAIKGIVVLLILVLLEKTFRVWEVQRAQLQIYVGIVCTEHYPLQLKAFIVEFSVYVVDNKSLVLRIRDFVVFPVSLEKTAQIICYKLQLIPNFVVDLRGQIPFQV